MARTEDVVFVTTAGRGSMDRYSQRLGAELPVARLELDVRHGSPEVFGAAALSTASLRALATDIAAVRRLRGRQGLLHLGHHHLARYAHFLPAPFLITVHDLIRHFDLRRLSVHISAPKLRDRLLLRLDYTALAGAAGIIAISETTKRDLLRHLRIPAERVFVVYQGLDHTLFRPVEQRLLDEPYVLFVGSEHPRKNLALLLRAFARLKRERVFATLKLVKVGEGGSAEAPFRQRTCALIRHLGLQREVVFTEHVRDADLPAYYSGARCLVLPSLYEGFGFPALEAMACGCPVVVSTSGALPEVVGDAAATVSAHDVDALTCALRTILTDPRVAKDMRARGLRRARSFSWERAAQATLDVYDVVTSRLCAPLGSE